MALIGNYRVINGITLLTMGKSMNEEDVDTIKEAGEKLKELALNVRLIQEDNSRECPAKWRGFRGISLYLTGDSCPC